MIIIITSWVYSSKQRVVNDEDRIKLPSFSGLPLATTTFLLFGNITSTSAILIEDLKWNE